MEQCGAELAVLGEAGRLGGAHAGDAGKTVLDSGSGGVDAEAGALCETERDGLAVMRKESEAREYRVCILSIRA